jgi:hypothetical protein
MGQLLRRQDDRIHVGRPQILAHLRCAAGEDRDGLPGLAIVPGIDPPSRPQFRSGRCGGGNLIWTSSIIQFEDRDRGSGSVKPIGNIGDLKIEAPGSGDADQITRARPDRNLGLGRRPSQWQVDDSRSDFRLGDADFSEITAQARLKSPAPAPSRPRASR